MFAYKLGFPIKNYLKNSSNAEKIKILYRQNNGGQDEVRNEEENDGMGLDFHDDVFLHPWKQ